MVEHSKITLAASPFIRHGCRCVSLLIGLYFSYDKNVRPHAVTEVENADGKISGDALTTSFNDFGKIELIEDAGKSLRMDFAYGPDQQRWYSELFQNGKAVRSTVYAGEYEKITENGVTREFYYLDGNTIAIRENGTTKTFFVFTDNLGSILSVMDENGTKVFDASYDAWGKQTVTLNTIGLYRGYTGHEMLNEFDIINSNGRLYDPVLGRFFSPDNYVQMPDNSQNFNRYSYCLNNPLKYTDPSGNLFGIDDAVIAFAAFNMASSMMQASFEGKNVWKAGALSLLSSAASYGIGSAFGNAAHTLGNELLRAGAHGLASGVVSALDGGNFTSAFVSGAVSSGIGSYAQSVSMGSGLMVTSTTLMGGVAAWATGGDFLQGAMQGMTIGLFNHAMHDNENIMGGSALCAVSSDGTYEVQESLKEVKIIANRLYKYSSTVPIEKPLESVYPEFGVIMLGRANVPGSVQVAWCIGKHIVGDFIEYVQSETGGISAWIRIHDSHSNSGNFDTRSVVWGSNTHYRKNIGNPTLRKYNEKLRNTRIPINNWRTTDNGHCHIRKR